MKRSQVFPSSYLSKDDVAAPVHATIADVTMEPVKGEHGEESKPVMHFTDKAVKPMIVNTTNWTLLEEMYGLDSDDWRGKPVELYCDPMVMFAGKRVGGVRVRRPSAAANHAPAGSPSPTPLWSFEQAVIEADKVGITKQELIDRLKGAGKAGYQASRDTSFVREMIQRQQGVTIGEETE
jgi:hypothetical protein